MRLVALLLLSATLSLATTLSYSVSGVLPSTIGTSAFSAPNAPFSVTFLLPDQPTPTFTTLIGFNVVTDVTYTLSSNTTTYTNLNVFFYDAASDGGLNVFFQDSTDFFLLGFSSSQLFTGTLANPQLLSGDFPIVYNTATVVALNGFPEPLSNTSLNISITETPEPSTLALAATALLTTLALRRRKRS